MKSSDLDALNKRIGSEILVAAGYVYKNKSWHLVSGDYQLTYSLSTDRNASGIHVKYMTLCLYHLSIPVGEDDSPFQLYSDLDGACPVQISPQLLQTYVSSGFDSAQWHFTNTQQSDKSEKAYQSFYYGGLDKWIMSDRSFTAEENHQQLEAAVAQFGARLISEAELEEVLENAISSIGRYGNLWADHMTPSEIIHQIRTYGDGWWIEKEWVKKYLQTFPTILR